ncbi:LLM class flavin-dependent oxidoreductase [Pseudomonas fluorescens]|uniref:LLM class flavin-dependent oxidoreductase n=1 Tax=Pseudomonas fluorescens TaxID=294 RepID=A0A345UWA5_PSEFL|nr:LLM class oxidoreductase [Pseudomonas fluorescens]AXJ04757.1 LLM class flavin-dependent oxidoreductase [Pseudomonas fluorescens]WJK12375.1 LLM class oxidoreductase [Pseudomonas fluorescens]
MLSLSTLPYYAQPAFRRTFEEGQLTLGAVFPIEAYSGAFPTMQNQAERARQAEAAGFAALWVRDVPLLDPDFGDVGQVFDPFVYLGYIAAQTESIALGTASSVVPLRNPLHLAKAATSVDQLSGGRLLLGVATGDRPVEFPAFGVNPEHRGELFREYIEVLRKSQTTRFEALRWSNGLLSGGDMVPKPFANEIPLLITGNSRQSIEWIAANGHGWINYPRPPEHQQAIIRHWRAVVQKQCGEVFKPFCCSLYVELTENPYFPPQAIHLGYRLGRNHLKALLELLRDIGVNHVMLNFRFGQRPAQEMIEELEQFVVPHFNARAN